MSPQPFMLGVAAGIANLPEDEAALMRAAGIGWLRCGNFGFDPVAFLNGAPQPPAFSAVKTRIRQLQARGFQIMGITPGPHNLPAPLRERFLAGCFQEYERLCAFLGTEFEGLIQWWQIANELDIWLFRDALTLDQSVAFLKAGIRGLKGAGPGLKAGINITLFPSRPGEVDGNTEAHEGLHIARGVYGDPSLPLDYAGFDSYPGTWREGGVESWEPYLAEFHRLTGKPVLIQEFGYSSGGEMMTAEESASGVYPCAARKWRFAWRGAHTPEIQAAFLEESLKVFARLPYVIGATYYRWDDQETCWQCRKNDCPVETSWGLIDRDRKPKPSYFALQAAAATHLADRPILLP